MTMMFYLNISFKIRDITVSYAFSPLLQRHMLIKYLQMLSADMQHNYYALVSLVVWE